MPEARPLNVCLIALALALLALTPTMSCCSTPPRTGDDAAERERTRAMIDARKALNVFMARYERDEVYDLAVQDRLTGDTVHMRTVPLLTAMHVDQVSTYVNDEGLPGLRISLTAEGTRLMGKFAEEYDGHFFVVISDGRILTIVSPMGELSDTFLVVSPRLTEPDIVASIATRIREAAEVLRDYDVSPIDPQPTNRP